MIAFEWTSAGDRASPARRDAFVGRGLQNPGGTLHVDAMTSARRFICSMCLLGSLFFGAVPWRIAVGTPAAQTRQPDSAVDLVKRGLDLADRDRPEEGMAAIKKAIAIAPADVAAHAAYIRIATYYLNRYEDVRKEYEKLSSERSPEPRLSHGSGAWCVRRDDHGRESRALRNGVDARAGFLMGTLRQSTTRDE